MLIKVLGLGCSKCDKTENIVAEAVQEVDNEVTVEKVTDLKEMMSLGIMSTPAVIIDSKIMCTGRVPSKKEVLSWIAMHDAKDLVAVDCDSPGGFCCGCKK